MKTSKQLTEEVLHKIAQKNKQRAKIKKYVQRTSLAAILVCALVPVSFYFREVNTKERYQPLGKSYETEDSSKENKDNREHDDSSDVTPGEVFDFESTHYTVFL